MESEVILSNGDSIKCRLCGCSCSSVINASGAWIRSVKRKYGEYEEGNRFYVPGFTVAINARVEVENECVALRETVGSQQRKMQDLYAELEEERNASSSAANEAMSMILKLQQEKAEVQMESRQFKRFAEEKMEHDQQELSAFEDLLYKREQTIQSLTCECQAYKHRMLSYGLTETEADGENSVLSPNQSLADGDAQFDLPVYDYPPLRCKLNQNPGQLYCDIDVAEVDTCPSRESPNSLKSLENRIGHMEKNSSFAQNVFEKEIVGHSPRRPRHYQKFSVENASSPLGMSKETRTDFHFESPRMNSSFKKPEYVSNKINHSNARNTDYVSEFGDDMSDRVYTIDSVYNGVTEGKGGVCDDASPRELINQPEFDDPYVKKLYMRLHALEADRESMRQAIVSMRTDKAQLLLLKEIAQQLSKEAVPEKRMVLRKASILRTFSIMPVFKWVMSFLVWRNKARRSKYMYGHSPSNMGLQTLLEKGPRTRQWRCIMSTQI